MYCKVIVMNFKHDNMKNLGQKIERVDDATNEIMDEIRDYFWKTHDIDLSEYYPNNVDDKFINSRDADDDIYTIIHNKLKQII